IAEERDAVRVLSRAAPLRGSGPLQVLMEQHLVGQFASRGGDGWRIATLELLRPLGPGALLLARVDRAEQAVVLEPPGLFARERPQFARSFGVGVPFVIDEALERAPQRRMLQTPDRCVLYPPGRARLVQQATIVRRQRRLSTERLELG